MMKLMSDLIAHLRDLLVFKVKPDALAEEAAPNAFGEEAGLIETDRLLELIEQFAEAEGRMKWAPNKKLHFEVAVIKAIQTLSQVTLDEVIENLAALRGGGGAMLVRPEPARPGPAKKLVIPPALAPNPDPTPTSAPDDMAVVWRKVVELSHARRPFIRSWIDAARYLGTEGRNLLLGLAPEEKTIMEGLLRPNNRSFLEALLKELTGSDWTLKLSLRENLPAAAAQPAGESTKTKPNDSLDSFKDDPLIQEALEIFKGEIKSVTT
jgi:hypothetical protein